MNPELLKFLEKPEIKKLKVENPDKFKILSEKIHLLTDAQKEMADLKEELNGTLDEKVDKLLGLIKEEEKNQKPTKQETDKAKKEVEKKGFSWESFTNVVKKNGGWFSLGGIMAGVSAFFSNIFSKLFKSVKKEASEFVESAVDLGSGESNGSIKGNKYFSAEKKLEIEKTDNDYIKKIKINGETYKIETNSREQAKIIDKSNKKYLAIGKNQIPLDRIGKIIDESKNKNEYFIDKNFLGGISDIKGIGDFVSELSDDFELKLVKESYYGEIKENIIQTGDTKIEFKEKIEGKDFPIENIKIKQIEINGKKYKIEPENQNFKLKKEGNKYLLSVELLDFEALKDLEVDDFEIDIRTIIEQINKKNKVKNAEEYYLFKPKIDFNFENEMLQAGANIAAEGTRPDIFLLKEIK